MIDILAHVSAWENEALTHLPHILEGKRPPKYSDLYGGIDAFNALKVRQSRAVSPAEVLARVEATHRQLVDYLESAPAEQLAVSYTHLDVYKRQRWRCRVRGR